MDTTQGGGEERKGRKEKKKDRKSPEISKCGGGEERGRGNILGKQSRAKIS